MRKLRNNKVQEKVEKQQGLGELVKNSKVWETVRKKQGLRES